MIKKIAMLLACVGALQASSIRLQNQARCPLKATIYGASGERLGELIVSSQETKTWSESTNPLERGNTAKSTTPFQVYWSCLDGEAFSVVDNISTGGFVTSGQGSGKKACPKMEEEK